MAELQEKHPSSQQIVEIVNIENDTFILKDGSLRAILLASGVNFDLMSKEEQEAIILNYQNFLNSFDFPVQIVSQSRNINIDSYISELERILAQETDGLMRLQLEDYIEFVKSFVEVANVMTKNFYIIVPYQSSLSLESIGTGILSKLGKLTATKTQNTNQSNPELLEAISQLDSRVATIIDNLGSLNIKVARLNNEELVELFYNLYNPEKFMRSEPSLLKILATGEIISNQE